MLYVIWYNFPVMWVHDWKFCVITLYQTCSSHAQIASHSIMDFTITWPNILGEWYPESVGFDGPSIAKQCVVTVLGSLLYILGVIAAPQFAQIPYNGQLS